MKKERLKLLAALLRHLPVKRFYLGTWADPHFADEEERSVFGEEYPCDTSACALGWATTIPQFRKAGLKFTGLIENDSKIIEFAGEEGFHAAAAFFEITVSQARIIFHPCCYNDGNLTKPQVVAKCIEEIIQEEES